MVNIVHLRKFLLPMVIFLPIDKQQHIRVTSYRQGVHLVVKCIQSGIDRTGVGLVNRIVSAIKMFQPMPVSRLTDGKYAFRDLQYLYESFYRFSSA